MSSLNKDKARDKTKVHRAVATIKGKKKPRGLVGGVFVDTSNTTRVERESQVEISKIVSTIDIDKLRTNTIDIDTSKQVVSEFEVSKVHATINDSTLDRGYISHAIRTLGFAKVLALADYAVRKGSNKGRAFVGLCEKIMREKYAQN